MLNRRVFCFTCLFAMLAALMYCGCSSPVRGGGGRGETDVGSDVPEPPITDDEPNSNDGGGTDLPEAVPVIDCSGLPIYETGVNLTPYYDQFPTVSLPGEVIVDDPPPSADLSEFLPPPCHQGQLRSCVAWAVGYYMMTYYAASGIDGWGTPDTSDRQFSPTFLFNQANAFRVERSRATSCDRAGSFVSDMMLLLQDTGCALMSDWPHRNDGDCQTQPPAELLDRASQFRISSFHTIDTDLNTMRTYLLQEIPVVIVEHVGPVFEALDGDEVYDTLELDGGGHAMLVVGYDDDRGAIRCINSWGENWGDGGYCWISYDIWEDFVAEAWVATPRLTGAGGGLVIDLPAGNPYADSDKDGIPDSMELEFADRGLDPNVPDENENQNQDLVDLPLDFDTDGWSDETELLFGTDATNFEDYPFKPGYEYPAGFFDPFDNAVDGVLERDEDLFPSDAGDQPPIDDGGIDIDVTTSGQDLPDDGIPIDIFPAPDSDNDGVPDDLDACPDTLIGFVVDEFGCPFSF